MNLLQRTERLVKQNWKERKRITLAVIVSFLINGGVGYATEEPVIEEVIIKTKEGSSIGVYKQNQGTIVDINKPNNDRISYNEYDIFDMKGPNAKVLLNNSGIDETETHKEESALGFKNVKKNKNFSKEDKADLIITEITGGNKTTLEGKLEVRSSGNRGQKPHNVDLIFANENGINVNGITYYNVDSVMYVNDHDWAKKDKLQEQKQALNKGTNGENSDITVFGNTKGSNGAIHKGEKEKKLILEMRR